MTRTSAGGGQVEAGMDVGRLVGDVFYDRKLRLLPKAVIASAQRERGDLPRTSNAVLKGVTSRSRWEVATRPAGARNDRLGAELNGMVGNGGGQPHPFSAMAPGNVATGTEGVNPFQPQSHAQRAST